MPLDDRQEMILRVARTHGGWARFGQFKRHLGISDKTLTKILRDLQESGHLHKEPRHIRDKWSIGYAYVLEEERAEARLVTAMKKLELALEFGSRDWVATLGLVGLHSKRGEVLTDGKMLLEFEWGGKRHSVEVQVPTIRSLEETMKFEPHIYEIQTGRTRRRIERTDIYQALEQVDRLFQAHVVSVNRVPWSEDKKVDELHGSWVLAFLDSFLPYARVAIEEAQEERRARSAQRILGPSGPQFDSEHV